MKKAFILLFAALMITCLFVSCEPDVDPDTVTDQFKGHWKLVGGFDELLLEMDGEGNFTFTNKSGGEIFENYSGKYSYDGSYLKLDASYPSEYTSSHPMYVFVHNDGGVYLGMDDETTSLPYAGHEEEFLPFEVDGSTYSYSGTLGSLNMSIVYDLGASSISFSSDEKKTDGATVLYETVVKGTAQAEYNPSYVEPDWYLKWFDETYSKYEITTKYTLSDNELTVYINGFEVTLKKNLT